MLEGNTTIASVATTEKVDEKTLAVKGKGTFNFKIGKDKIPHEVEVSVAIKGDEEPMKALLKELNIKTPGEQLPVVLKPNVQQSLDSHLEED